MWEIDWTRRKTEKRISYVWARNPDSIKPDSRKWHWTAHSTIRKAGIEWQRAVINWEVDWGQVKREGSNTFVWARNPNSTQARAREWHWTGWRALHVVGIEWNGPKRRRLSVGRSVSKKGYVVLYQSAMSEAEIELADKLGLWLGHSRGRRYGVWEHQLVAAVKYGDYPSHLVVRHINGDKTDNRPENLTIGTKADNARDHKTSALLMMMWRERALRAEGKNVIESIKESPTS